MSIQKDERLMIGKAHKKAQKYADIITEEVYGMHENTKSQYGKIANQVFVAVKPYFKLLDLYLPA